MAVTALRFPAGRGLDVAVMPGAVAAVLWP